MLILLEPKAQEELKTLKKDKLLFDEWLHQPVTKRFIEILKVNRDEIRKELEISGMQNYAELIIMSCINTDLLDSILTLTPDIKTNHEPLTIAKKD